MSRMRDLSGAATNAHVIKAGRLSYDFHQDPSRCLNMAGEFKTFSFTLIVIQLYTRNFRHCHPRYDRQMTPRSPSQTVHTCIRHSHHTQLARTAPSAPFTPPLDTRETPTSHLAKPYCRTPIFPSRSSASTLIKQRRCTTHQTGHQSPFTIDQQTSSERMRRYGLSVELSCNSRLRSAGGAVQPCNVARDSQAPDQRFQK
jgi:hypothetical protein